MIDLTKMNDDALEQFERRANQGKYQSGTVFAYHDGNFGDEVGFSRLGKLAWKLHERGKARLFQKKLGNERHLYLGVMV